MGNLVGQAASALYGTMEVGNLVRQAASALYGTMEAGNLVGQAARFYIEPWKWAIS